MDNNNIQSWEKLFIKLRRTNVCFLEHSFLIDIIFHQDRINYNVEYNRVPI